MDIPIRFIEAFIVEVECDVEGCTFEPRRRVHRAMVSEAPRA
jgi:hypothetical protein